MSDLETNDINDNNNSITPNNVDCSGDNEPFKEKMCGIKGCLNKVTNSKLIKFCEEHTCNFGANDEFLTIKCIDKCTSSSIKTCRQHTCKENDCVEPVTFYNVSYCKKH